MEALHGVDVSWLHRPTEGQGPTSTAPSQKPAPPPQPVKEIPVKPPVEPKVEYVSPPSQQTPTKSKRPTVLSKASSEKAPSKSSWMSNFSSKFSSSDKSSSDSKGSSAKQLASSPKNVIVNSSAPSSAKSSKDTYTEAVEEDTESSTAQSSKSGSFFSSALRRLSSTGPAKGTSVSALASTPAPRQTLNIDQDRERCAIEELDQSKLRRVAFRVDVELMGGSKYAPEPDPEKKKKSKDKFKEKGEGEALKHPEVLKKEMEASEKEEAEVSRHAKFEAEKPLLKQKDKSEGEALKHINAAREERARKEKEKEKEKAETEARKRPTATTENKSKTGKTPPTQAPTVSKIPSVFDDDDLDDLDPFFGGGRRRSSDLAKQKSEEQKPKKLEMQQENDSHDHLDHLDPFGGGVPSQSKANKPKPKPAPRRQDLDNLDPFAQKPKPGQANERSQQRKNDFDDMDDLDPFGGGGGGGGKQPEKKEKPKAKNVEEDDDDALDFFYKTGPPRDKAPSQWGVDLELAQDTPFVADSPSDSSHDEADDQETNSLATTTTNEQSAPTAEAETSPPPTSPPANIQAPTIEASLTNKTSFITPDAPFSHPAAASVPGDATPPTAQSATQAKSEDRPTTDPLRVYRRCCQLRESPVLKRISEQLGNVQNHSAEMPGTITVLNLNKSRMQLPDIVCLADWLAIVPVKKLTIEDANLTDDGLRLILAGLLAAKVPECKRKRGKSSPGQPRETTRCPAGMIERLSLKNNIRITVEGWMHLCLFLNMSKTIQAVDVSMIPFPAPPPPPAPPSGGDRNQKKNSVAPASYDVAEVLRKSLVAKGKKNSLRELLIAECGLTSYQMGKICEAAAAAGVERLGIASNHIDQEGLQYVARYLSSGVATGVDLGGNDIHNHMGVLTKAMLKNKKNPIWALSFANCNLTAKDLEALLLALVTLPDIRLLDLSHNESLFVRSDALSILRKYMPKLNMLKRLHLGATSMTPAHAIGIAEVVPECRNLSHINVLDNPQLKAVLVEPTDVAAQEEAAAVYASMMTAVRLSKTMLCVDIDVPGPKASEIVKALARQVVAFCLRNIERYTEYNAMKIADAAAALPDIEGDEGDNKPLFMQPFLDSPGAIDPEASEGNTSEDYIVGGSGIVKALSYCLNASQLRRMSAVPGTPRELLESDAGKATAKEMSKTLLDSAYKYRDSLQPMLAQQGAAGQADFETFRRLQFLNQTLQGMIERFEQEFPDCRQPSREKTPELPSDGEGGEAVEIETGRSRASSNASALSRVSADNGTSGQFGSYDISNEDGPGLRPYGSLHAGSRRSSEATSAAKVLAAEEAQMHRMGQAIRRQVLPPHGITDHLHGTSATDDVPEPEHRAALRAKLELLGGDEVRKSVLENGLDQTVRNIMEDGEKLRQLELTDPVEFRKFREAQMLAEQRGELRD